MCTSIDFNYLFQDNLTPNGSSKKMKLAARVMTKVKNKMNLWKTKMILMIAQATPAASHNIFTPNLAIVLSSKQGCSSLKNSPETRFHTDMGLSLQNFREITFSFCHGISLPFSDMGPNFIFLLIIPSILFLFNFAKMLS